MSRALPNIPEKVSSITNLQVLLFAKTTIWYLCFWKYNWRVQNQSGLTQF